MRVCFLSINNFRGIQHATINFPHHSVLIGDNNTGKTTILEALDLVLGPDRLRKIPPINEHDFFQGKYTALPVEEIVEDGNVADMNADQETSEEHTPEQPSIKIEAVVIDLNLEQKARFGDHIEFWDLENRSMYTAPDPSGTDSDTITEAIRVLFIGRYDPEEDDFEGRTYFSRSIEESEKPTPYTKKDKRVCGFLYLRSLRTGSRALSLERGSLLDIILRLKEVRPKMWEDTLAELAGYTVASDPDLGISGVLESINSALQLYVPKEWGVQPHLKISNLTREHLRQVITAFIATGEGDHAAPFYRQGTGTVNMLVLAMLSLIAQDKQNVIFAMEEPETAIPPYAQKRIVHEVRKLSSQTIFTSHSPYVLEEFSMDETVVLGRDESGILVQSDIELPASVKPKRYRQEFRTRFCEGLLSRRVLIAEGATEASAFPVACRRLAELDPEKYSSLEALGICTLDAGGENNIAGLANIYKKLGKQAFAICDKQDEESEHLIEMDVDVLLMHDERGFEDLVVKNTTQIALKRFCDCVSWPEQLLKKYPDPKEDTKNAVCAYFCATKAEWSVADFLSQCTEEEIPEWIRESCIVLKYKCEFSVESKLKNIDSENTSSKSLLEF